MPTAAISLSRLRALLRADVDDARLEQLLDQLGCDVDGVSMVRRYRSRHSDYVIELTEQESLPLTDPASGVTAERAQDLWEPAGEEQVIRLDLLPVRPDIFDAGGLARALRGYLGLETGLPHYHVAEPGPLGEGEGKPWRVEVDPDISGARPYIQCAIIRNLNVDEELLRAMMRLQEHLHWALCRDRKFASIGAYDLAALKNPIRYTLVDRLDFSFTPLLWAYRGPVSPETMLAEHPKGCAYAHLVDGQSRLPALIAANDVVLSLPPIINSEESKVRAGTRDVLIDVTGSNLPVVTRALAIMATSLLELDAHGEARLERVAIHYPDRVEQTPELAGQRFELHPVRAARLIGVELTRERCRELLLKMRHGVDDPSGELPLLVTVAPYRNDIMHEVDLIEDVAIAYGYHHIEPQLVPSFTAGRTIALNDLARRAASALAGMGFIETQSLVLTSERDHYEKMLRQPSEPRVTLANPISVDQTMLREHLYSGLLELLVSNTDQPYPQRVFETGAVAGYFQPVLQARQPAPPGADPPPTELRLIAGIICAPRTGYAEGRSALDALLNEMGYSAENVEYRADDGNQSALESADGRRRAASVHRADGARIAEVFELHPQVLENWRLENPAVAFSLLLGEEQYG